MGSKDLEDIQNPKLRRAVLNVYGVLSSCQDPASAYHLHQLYVDSMGEIFNPTEYGFENLNMFMRSFPSRFKCELSRENKSVYSAVESEVTADIHRLVKEQRSREETIRMKERIARARSRGRRPRDSYGMAFMIPPPSLLPPLAKNRPGPINPEIGAIFRQSVKDRLDTEKNKSPNNTGMFIPNRNTISEPSKKERSRSVPPSALNKHETTAATDNITPSVFAKNVTRIASTTASILLANGLVKELQEASNKAANRQSTIVAKPIVPSNDRINSSPTISSRFSIPQLPVGSSKLVPPSTLSNSHTSPRNNAELLKNLFFPKSACDKKLAGANDVAAEATTDSRAKHIPNTLNMSEKDIPCMIESIVLSFGVLVEDGIFGLEPANIKRELECRLGYPLLDNQSGQMTDAVFLENCRKCGGNIEVREVGGSIMVVANENGIPFKSPKKLDPSGVRQVKHHLLSSISNSKREIEKMEAMQRVHREFNNTATAEMLAQNRAFFYQHKENSVSESKLAEITVILMSWGLHVSQVTNVNEVRRRNTRRPPYEQPRRMPVHRHPIVVDSSDESDSEGGNIVKPGESKMMDMFLLPRSGTKPNNGSSNIAGISQPKTIRQIEGICSKRNDGEHDQNNHASGASSGLNEVSIFNISPPSTNTAREFMVEETIRVEQKPKVQPKNRLTLPKDGNIFGTRDTIVIPNSEKPANKIIESKPEFKAAEVLKPNDIISEIAPVKQLQLTPLTDHAQTDAQINEKDELDRISMIEELLRLIHENNAPFKKEIVKNLIAAEIVDINQDHFTFDKNERLCFHQDMISQDLRLYNFARARDCIVSLGFKMPDQRFFLGVPLTVLDDNFVLIAEYDYIDGVSQSDYLEDISKTMCGLERAGKVKLLQYPKYGDVCAVQCGDNVWQRIILMNKSDKDGEGPSWRCLGIDRILCPTYFFDVPEVAMAELSDDLKVKKIPCRIFLATIRGIKKFCKGGINVVRDSLDFIFDESFDAACIGYRVSPTTPSAYGFATVDMVILNQWLSGYFINVNEEYPQSIIPLPNNFEVPEIEKMNDMKDQLLRIRDQEQMYGSQDLGSLSPGFEQNDQPPLRAKMQCSDARRTTSDSDSDDGWGSENKHIPSPRTTKNAVTQSENRPLPSAKPTEEVQMSMEASYLPLPMSKGVTATAQQSPLIDIKANDSYDTTNQHVTDEDDGWGNVHTSENRPLPSAKLTGEMKKYFEAHHLPLLTSKEVSDTLQKSSPHDMKTNADCYTAKQLVADEDDGWGNVHTIPSSAAPQLTERALNTENPNITHNTEVNNESPLTEKTVEEEKIPSDDVSLRKIIFEMRSSDKMGKSLSNMILNYLEDHSMHVSMVEKITQELRSSSMT